MAGGSRGKSIWTAGLPSSGTAAHVGHASKTMASIGQNGTRNRWPLSSRIPPVGG